MFYLKGKVLGLLAHVGRKRHSIHTVTSQFLHAATAGCKSFTGSALVQSVDTHLISIFKKKQETAGTCHISGYFQLFAPKFRR